MKNFIKYFALCALVGLLVLGCTDPMNLPENHSEQGLLISVSAAGLDSRTLNPEQPVFSKYEVELVGPGGATDSRTILAGQTSVSITGLAAGTWEVSVTGFVYINIELDGGGSINDEFPAAWGSDEVEVTALGLTSCEIEISASIDESGDDGIFSYSINFPDDLVEYANISLYKQDPWYSYSFHSFVDYLSLSDGDSGYISLPPGNYLMQLRMSGFDVDPLARTEVVHIYSRMETKADYSFTAADFTMHFTLTGTVTATIDGIPAYGGYVNIFADIDCYNEIGWYELDGSPDTWEIQIRGAMGQTFYIGVDAWDEDYNWFRKNNVQSVTLNNKTTNINLTVAFTSITLSGTINVTLNGAAPDEAWLYLCRDADYYDFIGETRINGTSWTLKVPNDVAGTTVYFVVEAGSQFEGAWYGNWANAGSRAITAGMGSINLGTVAITAEVPIVLGGSLNVTIGGTRPDRIDIEIYEDAGYMYDIDWVAYEDGEDTWAIGFPQEYLGQTVYVKVMANYYDGPWYRYETYIGPVTLDGQKTTLNITHNFTPVIFVNLENVEADGDNFTTTTKLTLYFDKDIAGLSADDIELSDSSISKGTLSRVGTGEYTLPISGFNYNGFIEVTLDKDGYYANSRHGVYIYYQ